MLIFKNIKETRKIITQWKKDGNSIGFVPTMGFLHEGHISLIKRARKENDKVVVSIFVNPTQFGPNEDFASYPRNMERDRVFCEDAGTDLIFAPEATEVYPENNLTFIDIEELGGNLCGAKRQGHFKGVCTVVAKLFNIVTPDNAYFGQKDAQQLAIIKRMVIDLNFNVKIVPCEIIRETDGLAMSSRNSYLTPEQRKAALILSRSLNVARKALAEGERDTEVIKNIIKQKLISEPLAAIDYVEVVDSSSLQPVQEINKDILVAIAVFFGKTRLIDNFTFAL